ncbi:MAG: hypothetical protein LUP97_05890 [Methanoregula sp.]|nr:hypothetical protein [Methanoregula sp.]
MSPRHQQKPAPHRHITHSRTHLGVEGSMDMDRHDEDKLHHTENHEHPHQPKHPLRHTIEELNPQPPHTTMHKPPLPPRHDTHSHPHGDELPPHTNKPGPIKPEKKLTRTGAKP